MKNEERKNARNERTSAQTSERRRRRQQNPLSGENGVGRVGMCRNRGDGVVGDSPVLPCMTRQLSRCRRLAGRTRCSLIVPGYAFPARIQMHRGKTVQMGLGQHLCRFSTVAPATLLEVVPVGFIKLLLKSITCWKLL